MRWAAAAALALLVGSPALAQTAPAPTATVVADPALHARGDDVLKLLQGAIAPDALFTPDTLKQMSADQLRAAVTQVTQGLGSAQAITSYAAVQADAAKLVIRFANGTATLLYAIDPAGDHRLTGLRFIGADADETSLAAVTQSLAALPGRTGLLLVRLDPPGGAPMVALNADQPFAVGSAFKLVVLAELVRAIAAGERHWDDTVTLTGAQLPGGLYTQKPKGTAVPLKELAERMISVSDNSATDILIGLLGRAKIEAMLPVVGIARPEAMRPLLTTLEMFKLKGIDGGRPGDRFLAADEAGRRAILGHEIDPAPLSAVSPDLYRDGQPNRIGIEWSESPADLVRVLDWLRTHTESGPAAEARRILAINPGVPADAAAKWRYLGYKGGSEPGVIAMALLLQGQDGHWNGLAGGWNDPAKPVAEGRFIALISRAVALAAPAATPGAR